MGTKEVALDVARFLDSTEARALAEPSREDVRRIARLAIELCYNGLGTEPRRLDAEDVRALLGRLLPGRLARRDPLADHVPVVLRAWLDHLEATQVVPHAFEVRRALAETEDAFLAAVRSGRGESIAPPRRDPLVHRAPKLGRNDPCFCGSGRKFKKCCGKSL